MSSRKPVLSFSPHAQADLDSIHHYTLAEWGERQFDDYSRHLEKAIQQICDIPTIGMRRRLLAPELRAYQVKKHLIIYRATDEAIRIMRILHINRSIPRSLS